MRGGGERQVRVVGVVDVSAMLVATIQNPGPEAHETCGEDESELEPVSHTRRSAKVLLLLTTTNMCTLNPKP